jgi:hypothetical protein
MWLITPPYSCLWRPSRGPCSAYAIHYINMFFIHAYLLDINILFLISFFFCGAYYLWVGLSKFLLDCRDAGQNHGPSRK